MIAANLKTDKKKKRPGSKLGVRMLVNAGSRNLLTIHCSQKPTRGERTRDNLQQRDKKCHRKGWRA